MVNPHGGRLVNRVLRGKKREKALEEAEELKRLDVTWDSAKDVENLAEGVFSPLEGFMDSEELRSVLYDMRLPNDVPWTIPIILEASRDEVKDIEDGDTITLMLDESSLALMNIREKYVYDKKELAKNVFKTTDAEHPGVAGIYNMKDVLVGGKISLLNKLTPRFPKYTLSPVETRVLFKERGWKTVVGFQTRNAPHLGHEYVQKFVLSFVDGLFINPLIGWKKKGDFKDEVILKAYEVLLRSYYLKENSILAVLETYMRYAGPREAIFHAIIRKNFGCTHFIVGRDHAGVGNYYRPYEAQEIFNEFPDLGIAPIPLKTFFYCKKCGGIVNEKICPHRGKDRVDFSGTKLRKMLLRGERPPKELMRPEVVDLILKWKNPFVE